MTYPKKISLFIFLSLLIPSLSFAAARYYPGQTLTPDCGPTDADCTVSVAAIAGNNADITSLSGLTSITSNSLTITNLLSLLGNLGLGTTSPWAKLSIAGLSSNTAPLFTISTTTFGNATSTAFIVDTNGKVGIGTSSPYTQLSTAGGVAAAYFNADNAGATSTFAGGLTASVINMNSSTIGVSTIPAATTPLAYTPVVGNLVSNPSFETSGSPAWANWNFTGTGGTAVDETVAVHSGGHAAKLTASLAFATPKIYSDNITVTANTTYYFSFWTRGDGFNTGTYYIRDVSNSGVITTYTTTGISEPAYRQLTGSFVTPAGCTSIYLMFSTAGGPASAVPTKTAYPPQVWFDDVVISAAPIIPDPASPNPTAIENIYPAALSQGLTPSAKFWSGIDLGGIAAPTAPTVAIGASGSLSGTYHYLVTYVTLNGESAMGTVSAAISPSSQKVNITNIPISTSPTVIARNIFREKAGVSGTYYFLTALTDNTTTTYTDNTTDGNLGYDNHYLSSSLAAASGIYILGHRVFKDLGVGLAIGQDAGMNLSQWDNDTLVGDFAGTALTTANYTTIVGSQAGILMTTQSNNTLVGGKAGYFIGNTGMVGSGDKNTMVGSNAGNANNGGYNNTFLGYYSGNTGTSANANVEGHDNTFLGYQTGSATTIQHNYMTVIGSGATGNRDNSIILGGSIDNVGIGTTSPYAKLSITGSSVATTTLTVYGFNNQTAPLALFATTTGNATSTAFLIDSRGQVGLASSSPWRTLSVVGTVGIQGLTSSAVGNALCITSNNEVTTASVAACAGVSSLRFKHDVMDTDLGLSTILNLHPVSFKYNEGYGDSGKDQQFGLIAEEVQKIDSRLIILDSQGLPTAVRYDFLPTILIRAVQELSAKVQTLSANAYSGASGLASNLTEWVGEKVTATVGYFKNLVVGDTGTPTNITVFDKNGKVGCVTVDDVTSGSLKLTSGACSAAPAAGAALSSSPSTNYELKTTNSPTITLLGNNPATIDFHSTYIDPGATALDANGVSLMPDIASSTVNTSIVGTYQVIWTVHDSAMNFATTTRSVIVIDRANATTTATTTSEN